MMKINRFFTIGLVMLLALSISFSAPGIVAGSEVTDDPRMGGWLDSIQIEEIGDAAEALNRIEAGSLDVYGSALNNISLYERAQGSALIDEYLSYGSYIELTFNPHGPTFNNGKLNPFSVARVREAMNWLVDRGQIEALMGGLAAGRWTPFSGVSADAALAAETVRALELKYAYDLQKARQVIGEEMTGLGAVQVDGQWRYNGQPVEIILLIRTEDRRLQVGSYVADQLAAQGFSPVRDFRTSAEASPCWTATEPAEGCFHIYTGGWGGATTVTRDSSDLFEFFYTPRGLPFPLWAAYQPDPVFDGLAADLAARNYADLDQRQAMITQALDLALQDSVHVWLAGLTSFTARKPGMVYSSDFFGGFAGSQLTFYTLRDAAASGGTAAVGYPYIFADPWNPVAGSSWLYDQSIQRATLDAALLLDPFNGLNRPQRIASAAVTVQSGLPVRESLGWVDLGFANEIEVPADAWVDWDAATKTFITAGTQYPDGLTALRKSVVVYPADLFSMVEWHDGSPLSPADFVMNMILKFDRAKEESPVYDPSAVGAFDAFMSSFRGVRIVSANPLTIETYSDRIELDAENMVDAWWPSCERGPCPWHVLVPGLMAEEIGMAAFSPEKAGEAGIQWLNYVDGVSLYILASRLAEAQGVHYVPYAATLAPFLGSGEVSARYGNLRAWYTAKGHFWVGSGPYYLDTVDTGAKTATLTHFANFPDPADKWIGLTEPIEVEVGVSGPAQVGLDQAAVFPIDLASGGSPLDPAQVERVRYLLVNRAGEVALSGDAQQPSPGDWQVVITADQFRAIPGGSYRLEIIVLTQGSVIPNYRSFLFDLNAYRTYMPLLKR